VADVSPRQVQRDEEVVEYPCKYAQSTGDERWPVLCLLDNRYASKKNCYNCRSKRMVREDERSTLT
jgi:hypothetical protein